MTQVAFFLDRDDTIIKNIPYLGDPELVDFLPHSLAFLKALQEKNIWYFMVTNQSGIGRGLITESQMRAVNRRIEVLMQSEGIEGFKDIAFCPHHPDEGCLCRKPSPKMITDLMLKWNLAPENCFMVGDKSSDYLAGQSAKVSSFQLVSKKQEPYQIIQLTDLLKLI